jgi:membrane-bound serine protease (ClpP class)
MRLLIRFLITALLLAILPLQAYGRDRVVVVKIDGAINPIVAEFVSGEIESANSHQESLIVIEMDTPGGLDTSMRQIIKAIQSSRVPVATYVSPSGSRAASAGTFITIASHIAAMAPGTNIGAAHPVNLMGGGRDDKDKTMENKVVNDAAAYMRALAEKRGRNAHWAEMAVVKSVSISAEEAKKLAVIDLVAGNLEALLMAIDGREIKLDSSATVILQTKGKSILYREMSKRQKILDIISSPNVAYILMMMGMIGIYFELSNPGLILPGVIGAISIILALFAMQALPINYAGLMLIVLGVIMFIAEINIMSYGLLSVGGAISVFLGSLMLMDTDDPAMQISRVILYPTLFFSIAVSLGILYMATRSRGRKVITGIEGMIGETGIAKTELNPTGSVLVHGETWTAECEGQISEGTPVTVKSIHGLTVKVEPESH